MEALGQGSARRGMRGAGRLVPAKGSQASTLCSGAADGGTPRPPDQNQLEVKPSVAHDGPGSCPEAVASLVQEMEWGIALGL